MLPLCIVATRAAHWIIHAAHHASSAVVRQRCSSVAYVATVDVLLRVAVDIDGMAPGVSLHEQPPVYSMQPVLPNSNGLWQFLHALLMLAAFGFLLPLGVLLARHKWMFGRNPDTVSREAGWGTGRTATDRPMWQVACVGGREREGRRFCTCLCMFASDNFL